MTAFVKGSIENLVGWVKGSFFKQRRFLDDADLLTQLAEWRTEVNTQRPCRATRVIPAVRLEEERPRLRLHALLATYGDDAVRAAFARGLAEQAIGAEYIAHYLAAAVTTLPPMEGDGTGHPPVRSSFLGHPGKSISHDEQLRLDLPSATAPHSSADGGRS